MTSPAGSLPNGHDFLISELFVTIDKVNNDLHLLTIETVKKTNLVIEESILLNEYLEATQNVLSNAEESATKQNIEIKKIKEEMNTPFMRVIRAICNFVSYIFNILCKVIFYTYETSSYHISKAHNIINFTLRAISGRE